MSVSDPRGALLELIRRRRVVVCVGSGGVGKTTTAAALAVRAAMQGRRVLCLTIDPARRLANSLGLQTMRAEEQEVTPEIFQAHGLHCEGTLSVMMLDAKRTFDDLVRRYASSPASRARILNNKLYQYVSTSFAGTQEYMAMEKLHAVKNDPRFDLIILDTPPTTNALDFLDAPDRLVGIIDSPAMRWLVEAFDPRGGRLSLSLLGKGASLVFKGLSRFTGAEFLDAMARFVADLNELFGGFRARASEVRASLRSGDVAFVIVTSPAPLAVSEAVFFAQKLREQAMARDAFVVNRVRPLPEESRAPDTELVAEIEANAPADIDAAALLAKMRAAYRDARLVAVADRVEVDRLRQVAQDETAFVEVPSFDEDVHDLRALHRVGEFLVGA